MAKLGRLLLWLIGGAIALAGVLLIAINLYVQSQGMHRRIQQELSQRLGTPLRLRQISITPWNGLKLNGITIPQEQHGMSGNFLQAQSFQLRIEWWSLFTSRLIIRSVSLVKPTVVWAQNSAGKWRLPSAPAPLQPSLSRPGAAASPIPRLTAPPVLSPDEAQRSSEPASVPFTPEVRRVRLKDGDFTFLDSVGRMIATFTGLNFSSGFRTATAISGNASVEKISLRDRFFIQNLESPLEYDPAQLDFSSISAEAAGGKLRGRFHMDLQVAETPFSARVKFGGLQAAQLVANAGGPPGMIEGRVEGFLDASGKTADPNALSGKGQIVMHEGKLQQYSLLVALGQILQIDELMQLNLEQAEVDYHISPGIVTVDQLILRSPNIRLTATGTINFDGKLHLNSQLALNEKIRRRLFAPIRENFQPIPQPAGFAAVDFKIAGTVDRPRTDLMDKIVGHDLRDLGGVISSLFGGHSKKKKARANPSAAAVASPLPSPTGVAPNESAAGSSPAAPSPVSSPSP